MKMKFLAVGLMCAMSAVGCSRDAQVASKNLSYAADNLRNIRWVSLTMRLTFQSNYLVKV